MTGTLLRDSKQKIRDVEGIYWSMALKLWDKLGGAAREDRAKWLFTHWTAG